MKIKENERIDDLECNGLKIIQEKDSFCFGIDSVILSEFAKNIKKTDKVLDLGTGTGILGFLLYGKRGAEEIIGVEIQKDVAERAERSVKLNKLEKSFKIINSDIKDIFSNNLINKNEFDVVISNPPYKEIKTGIINETENKIISRHESTAKLEDFISIAGQALKHKGCFYMVHKPERLVDIMYLLRKYKLEPKEMRLVSSYKGKEPHLVLIKAVKCARKFLKILNTLYIYDENREYCEEIKKIYNK